MKAIDLWGNGPADALRAVGFAVAVARDALTYKPRGKADLVVGMPPTIHIGGPSQGRQWMLALSVARSVGARGVLLAQPGTLPEAWRGIVHAGLEASGFPVWGEGRIDAAEHGGVIGARSFIVAWRDEETAWRFAWPLGGVLPLGELSVDEAVWRAMGLAAWCALEAQEKVA